MLEECSDACKYAEKANVEMWKVQSHLFMKGTLERAEVASVMLVSG